MSAVVSCYTIARPSPSPIARVCRTRYFPPIARPDPTRPGPARQEHETGGRQRRLPPAGISPARIAWHVTRNSACADTSPHLPPFHFLMPTGVLLVSVAASLRPPYLPLCARDGRCPHKGSTLLGLETQVRLVAA
jgi:hypothetical protein